MRTKMQSIELASRINNKSIKQRLFAEIIDAFHESDVPQEDASPAVITKTKQLGNNDSSVGDFDGSVVDIDTGITNDRGLTRYPILDGFWLQGDFVIFFTLDVEKNDIYRELFQFAQSQLKVKFVERICSRKSFDSWSLALDAQRKYISLLKR